jgi:hypothetical protein
MTPTVSRKPRISERRIEGCDIVVAIALVSKMGDSRQQ